MEQYAIKGGNPLVGEVEIGGAKNAALPILAASVMTDETVYIENMPDVRDTNVLLSAMQNIGVLVKRNCRHKVTLNASNISNLVVEDDNIKKIRASYYLIGALPHSVALGKPPRKRKVFQVISEWVLEELAHAQALGNCPR